MLSLRQILEAHHTALVVDAASSRIQAGWLTTDANRWASSTEEAGRGVFHCLETLQVDLNAAGALIFCEGPGSILGIRTTAAAIRTWTTLRDRAVYSYQSLNLVAQALNQPEASIIADARRELWHCQRLNQPLKRIATAELDGALITPEGFRHWSAAPDGVTTTPYDLATLFSLTADKPIFTPCAEPDAFMHSEPDYKTWTPQIHRAP